MSDPATNENLREGRGVRPSAGEQQGGTVRKGWQTKTIGDVCEVIAGQSPEGKFYNAEGKGMPFYQGKKDFGDKFIEAPTTWTTQTTKIAKEGDILMSVRAPVGPVNFATDEVCIGRGLAAIRSSDELNRDFLFYQLWHLQPEIAGREGAVFASINKAEIEALPLAYAPLAEQQRIVGLLDEAFEGLATAKANAEKNLQNARALFESHLQAVFTQRGPGWVERPLGDCVNSISTGPFGSLLHKSDYEQSGIPLVNPINIEGDQIIPDDRKTIGRATAIRLASYVLRENDIVIGRRGEIGRCAVISSDQAGWLCGTGCFFIRPSDKTDPHYLTHLLRSYPYRSILEGASARATMPSISNDDLARLVVWLPPMAQQRRTLKLLESLSTKTQRLARLYEQKLALLTALKKSLLHQAFTGEL